MKELKKDKLFCKTYEKWSEKGTEKFLSMNQIYEVREKEICYKMVCS
jgi:hypothetical protein